MYFSGPVFSSGAPHLTHFFIFHLGKKGSARRRTIPSWLTKTMKKTVCRRYRTGPRLRSPVVRNNISKKCNLYCSTCPNQKYTPSLPPRGNLLQQQKKGQRKRKTGEAQTSGWVGQPSDYLNLLTLQARTLNHLCSARSC